MPQNPGDWLRNVDMNNPPSKMPESVVKYLAPLINAQILQKRDLPASSMHKHDASILLILPHLWIEQLYNHDDTAKAQIQIAATKLAKLRWGERLLKKINGHTAFERYLYAPTYITFKLDPERQIGFNNTFDTFGPLMDMGVSEQVCAEWLLKSNKVRMIEVDARNPDFTHDVDIKERYAPMNPNANSFTYKVISSRLKSQSSAGCSLM